MDMSLDDLLERYQIKKEKSPTSGTLWVRHFHEIGVVGSFLIKQGFIFKSSAEGFYPNPRNFGNY